MGYHIRTGLVEDHSTTLDMILAAANQGKSLRFDCHKPEQMSQLKYKFNRILRATTVLIHEADGVYVGLRTRVRVREDWANFAIIIEPAVPSSLNLSTILPTKPNEHDALERLRQFEGQMDLVRFTPSPTFNVENWVASLEKIGFELMKDPDKPGEYIGGAREDGDIDFAVARVVKRKVSGFDLIAEGG